MSDIVENKDQSQPITINQLATYGMDALDRKRVDAVQVSASAGGITFASALEVMEFAKLLSTSGKMLPRHLRANPGACLAITFQAIEWRMSPIAVANKSYEVNDRIAYESQLLHAIIEARGPLKERLNCRYDGEGQDRTCTVIGKFNDGTTREYTSPKLKDIRVKNSPLWKDDPDQQLFFFSSRSWARKWCPDVLMGIYTREEIEAYPEIGREEFPNHPTITDRLKDAPPRAPKPDATTELDNIAGGGTVEILPADKKPAAKAQPRTTTLDKAKPATKTVARLAADRAEASSKKAAAAPKADPAPIVPPAKPQPTKMPTNAAEYEAYADAWADACKDADEAAARWEGEMDMRADLRLPMPVRKRLQDKLNAKFSEK